MYKYEYDIYKKEVVKDCKLHPTEVSINESAWLRADNNKYEDWESGKVGKWMLFIPKMKIDEIWDKVKMAVTNGDLWHTKVSTTEPDKYKEYAIMIYTKDYTDLNDVIEVLDYIESSGLKPYQRPIYYKTDKQTYAGIYSGGRQRPWIYCSSTIRNRVDHTT